MPRGRNAYLGPARDRLVARIKANQIMHRVQRCALGIEVMTVAELRAADMLLKKVAPDLKLLEVDGNVNVNHQVDRVELKGRLIEAGLDPEVAWRQLPKH